MIMKPELLEGRWDKELGTFHPKEARCILSPCPITRVVSAVLKYAWYIHNAEAPLIGANMSISGRGKTVLYSHISKFINKYKALGKKIYVMSMD